MDLETVRTFVAVADAGQFSEAADGLSITQQAVSKRVAALEKRLDPHPALAALRDHFGSAPPDRAGTWTPAWGEG